MIVFVDCACHPEANYCRFFLPPVRMTRNLPSSSRKSRIACRSRFVMHKISDRMKFWVKVDPRQKREPVIRFRSCNDRQRSLRWRCRKIVHHFVMLHGYRSARGRVASHSMQPAGYGSHHEGRGRVGLYSRGLGREGAVSSALLVGRIDLSHETSLQLVLEASVVSVGVGARCACVRVSSGNPRGAHRHGLPLDSLLLIRSRSSRSPRCSAILRLPTEFLLAYLSILEARFRLVRSDETSARRSVECAHSPSITWLRMIVFSDKRKWRTADECLQEMHGQCQQLAYIQDCLCKDTKQTTVSD